MYVLAIETTGAFASPALMRDGEIIVDIRGLFCQIKGSSGVEASMETKNCANSSMQF